MHLPPRQADQRHGPEGDGNRRASEQNTRRRDAEKGEQRENTNEFVDEDRRG